MNAEDIAVAFAAAGYRYRRGTRDALADISLSVPSGDVCGLVGHNGAGKTTLLLLTAGVLVPTRGDVTVCGLAADDASLRSRVGICSERFVPDRRFTVGELARTFASMHDAALAEVEALFDRLGLREHWHVRSGNLSTGLQKRLAIAISVMHNPSVILLDEPFAGIDPMSVGVIVDLIRQWREEGRSIVVSSHDLAELELCVDRLAVLENGQVIAEGAIDELRSSYGLSRTVRIETDRGAFITDGTAASLAVQFRQLVDDGATVLRVASDHASLTDLYRAVHARTAEPTMSAPAGSPPPI